MNFSLENLRAELEKPFHERCFFLFLVTPVLYFLALLYSCVLELRRVFFLVFLKPRQYRVPDLPVVSVGNIAVGGTGKSPLIRKLTNDFLSRGFAVCVLSRGYGAGPNSQGIYFEAEALELEYQASFASLAQNTKQKISRLAQACLSDESLELLYFLRSWSQTETGSQPGLQSGLQARWVIAQFSERYVLVEALAQIFPASFGMNKFCGSVADSIATQNKSGIVLLDDGMQHIRCPRDVDICVWSLDRFQQAPRYCFPLGSYREGFGPFFRRVTRRAKIHVWNVAQGKAATTQESDLMKWAGDENLFPDALHWLMHYQSAWAKQVEGSAGMTCELMLLAQAELPPLGPAMECGVVTGIGAPWRFVEHLEQSYGKAKLKIHSHFFTDHESYNERIGAVFRLSREQKFFLTLKDWLRWRSSEHYCRDTSGKEIFVCLVDAKLKPLKGTQELSDSLVSVLASRRS